MKIFKEFLKEFYGAISLAIHIVGISWLILFYLLLSIFMGPGGDLPSSGSDIVEATAYFVIPLTIVHALYLFFSFKFRFINEGFVITYLTVDCALLGWVYFFVGLSYLASSDAVRQQWNECNAFAVQSLVCVGGIVLRIVFSIFTLRFINKSKRKTNYYKSKG